MTWWGYALLGAACWGVQYLLLEVLFEKVNFAAAATFLGLASGVLIAALMYGLYPQQNWRPLWQSWSILGLVVLYLLAGSGAYLFSTFAIRDKNATVASLLEISYPLFIILFTAVFLRKIHLNALGFLGALLILAGCALVVGTRAD
jgi:drug/metabolite transporter (DMT)-like permease